MSLRRFFVDTPPENGSLSVEGEEVHHIRDVTRLRRGESLEVTDGKGWVHRCTIEGSGRNRLHLTVINSHFSPPVPLRLWLCISLLKGKAMNFVVERLTEMGVGRLTPILFSRTELPSGEDRRSKKWYKIAEQAIKVNDNPWLPRIDDPMTLDELIHESVSCPVKLLLDLSPRSKPLGVDEKKPPVVCLIGPPGGITDSERDKMEQAGFSGVKIGPWTLRSETAAMYAAACLDMATREEVGL
jgi:16S rRNA (uracil1498-N3)-methyltransferase